MGAVDPLGMNIAATEEGAELSDVVLDVPRVVGVELVARDFDPGETGGASEGLRSLSIEGRLKGGAAVIEVGEELSAGEAATWVFLGEFGFAGGVEDGRGFPIGIARGVAIGEAQGVVSDVPEGVFADEAIPLFIGTELDAGFEHGEGGEALTRDNRAEEVEVRAIGRCGGS